MSGSGSLESFSLGVDNGRGSLACLSLLEVGNDGPLETELDQVEREVPDDVPNPDDTDPSTRDSLDIGEVPVTETGDDGRYELSNTERRHERNGRSLSPRRTVRSSDKDEGLGNDGDLEVNDHVTVVVVDVLGVGCNSEFVLEEVGVVHDGEKGDGRCGEVEAVTNTVGENFCEVPRVGGGRRKHSVEGEGHDGAVVQDRNDKNHERREVELPDKCHDGETDHDSDGNGTSVHRVVPHTAQESALGH